jgi:hypothetical protein
VVEALREPVAMFHRVPKPISQFIAKAAAAAPAAGV